MQNLTWFALLQRIPPAQHDNLLILTSTGTEIAIQGILRMEEEYLVVRGRLSGTTDAGRVLFLPYNEITFLAFQKPIKEKDVYAIYGEDGPPAWKREAESAAHTAAPDESQAVDVASEPESAPLAEVTQRPGQAESTLQ